MPDWYTRANITKERDYFSVGALRSTLPCPAPAGGDCPPHPGRSGLSAPLAYWCWWFPSEPAGLNSRYSKKNHQIIPKISRPHSMQRRIARLTRGGMWPRCIWPMVICCWAQGIVPMLRDSVPMEPERITPGSATEPCSTRPTRLNCCCRMVDLRKEDDTAAMKRRRTGEVWSCTWDRFMLHTPADGEPLGVVRTSFYVTNAAEQWHNNKKEKNSVCVCVCVSGKTLSGLQNCVGLWPQNKERRHSVLPLHGFEDKALFFYDSIQASSLWAQTTKTGCKKMDFLSQKQSGT